MQAQLHLHLSTSLLFLQDCIMTSSLSFSHLFRSPLVIVADRDHNMLVVERHPGGHREDRTSSLQHDGPQGSPQALEPSFYNRLSEAINKSLAICSCGEFLCDIRMRRCISGDLGVIFLRSKNPGECILTPTETLGSVLNSHVAFAVFQRQNTVEFNCTFNAIKLVFPYLIYLMSIQCKEC